MKKLIISESKKVNDFTQEEKDQIVQIVYEYLVLQDGDGSHKLVHELFKLLWGYFKRIGKPGPWQKR
jgi:hypothetical protein